MHPNLTQTSTTVTNNINFNSLSERIMDALVELGGADFLLLKDDEIRNWWGGVVNQREAVRRQQEELQRREQLRAQALSKLTDEERNALGLTASGGQLKAKDSWDAIADVLKEYKQIYKDSSYEDSFGAALDQITYSKW